MTDLEIRINELLDSLSPTSKTDKAFSNLKKTLNSSSKMVESVNSIGDSLQTNIQSGVGGVTGAIGGWVAGKTTKLVGNVAGGVVSGALKTVADIIPDSSDIKTPETDSEIARCIDSCVIPADKDELFELLQYCWNNMNPKSSPFGNQAVKSFKTLHSKVHTAFLIAANDDSRLLKIAKPYFPPKRFGIF